MQSTVGTVVKSVGEEDEVEEDSGGDPLGVISVLSTERYRQLKCLEEIKTYLLSHCDNAECKATLEKVIQRALPQMAFLLSDLLNYNFTTCQNCWVLAV